MSIRIQTNDNQTFQLERNVALKLGIVKNMMDDGLVDSANEEENMVPINIDSKMTSKIVEFCEHYQSTATPEIEEGRGVDYCRPVDALELTEWDYNFFANDPILTRDLADASVFLECRHLQLLAARRLREFITFDPVPTEEELDRWVAPVSEGGKTLQELRDAAKKAGVVYGYDEGLDKDDQVREGWKELFLARRQWDAQARKRHFENGGYWGRRAYIAPSEQRKMFNQPEPAPLDPRFYVPTEEEFREWFNEPAKGGLTLERLRWYASQTGVEPSDSLTRNDFKEFFQERSQALYGRPIPVQETE